MACSQLAAQVSQRWSESQSRTFRSSQTSELRHRSSTGGEAGSPHPQGGDGFTSPVPGQPSSAAAGEERAHVPCRSPGPRTPENDPAHLEVAAGSGPKAASGEGVGEDPEPVAPVEVVRPDEDEASSDDEALTCQQHLYLLIEEPDSGLVARILSHVVLITIVLSIAGFILHSVPEIRAAVPTVFDVIEIGSTAIFTLEYVLRLLVCNAFGEQTRLAFVRAPMNILDLMAILPFYVERSLDSLELKAFRVLRSARLIRIFRIFKLSKYSLGMNLMVESLVNSVHPLSVLAFFLCIGVLLFSALLYYAERMSCPTVRAEEWAAYAAECLDSSSGWTRSGDLCCDEHKSAADFPSIRSTFWWSIVTMTTVGYGDTVPRTGPGRVVAGLAMISGIILISLPVAIVGAKFQMAYEEFELDREEMLLLEKKANEAKKDNPPEMKRMSSSRWKKIRTAMKVTAPRRSSKESVTGEQVVIIHKSRRLSRESSTTSVGSIKRSLSQRSTSHAAWAAPGEPVDGQEGRQDEQPIGARQSSVGRDRPPPPTVQAVAALTEQLKQLESRSAMSSVAQEQIQLLLELFEHVTRAERHLGVLREKDAKLDASIRGEFASLSRRYDTHLARELSNF